MTIKTLFFYDHLFKKDGFKYYFDEFIKEYACYEKNNIIHGSFVLLWGLRTGLDVL